MPQPFIIADVRRVMRVDPMDYVLDPPRLRGPLRQRVTYYGPSLIGFSGETYLFAYEGLSLEGCYVFRELGESALDVRREYAITLTDWARLAQKGRGPAAPVPMKVYPSPTDQVRAAVTVGRALHGMLAALYERTDPQTRPALARLAIGLKSGKDEYHYTLADLLGLDPDTGESLETHYTIPEALTGTSLK